MPITRLIATSLPDLLPMRDRSSGLHVSDVIHDICVRLGDYERSEGGPEMSRLQLGCALEDAIKRRYTEDRPGEYVQGFETQLDGLYLTDDLLCLCPWRVHEIKFTWMSSRAWPCGIDDVDLSPLTNPARQAIVNQYHADGGEHLESKYRKYWLQGASYCHARGTNTCHLTVIHAMGAYRDFRVDARTWERVWTDDELRDNWSLITRHAATMV